MVVPDQAFAEAMSDALDETLDQLARSIVDAAEATDSAVALDDP